MEVINSRVFMSGNNQAIRIPKRFKLNSDEVTITQTVDGALIIRPIPQDRGTFTDPKKQHVHFTIRF